MRYTIYIIGIIVVLFLAWYLFQPRTQTIEGDNPAPLVVNEGDEYDESSKDETVLSIEEIVQSLENLAKEFDNRPPFEVERVWVEGDKFYVEYRNATETFAQLLVTKEEGEYRGRGYFSPSESGWVLQTGEGELVGADAALYEQNDQGKWMRKN